jgi:hypothetical protein
MHTGENEQGLRKIVDLTRMISLVLLILHFYYYCNGFFFQWGWHSEITDRFMGNLFKTGLFSSLYKSKILALVFLVISLLGARGRKDEDLKRPQPLIFILSGLLLYFLSGIFLDTGWSIEAIAIAYMITTAAGFLIFLSGGVLLSRIIRMKLSNSVFNSENETFPQEERLLANAYSVNLPARYRLKGRIRKSWINIINPFRGLLIMGSPGSGKSYFVVQHIIRQHIQKGFSMFVYDFKFDDLTRITYNQYLKNKSSYPVCPKFCVINFDDLSRSHRCNPLDVSTMHDITDAAESSRTIMLGLNREWIKKTGDFFVESPINFVTALIWFLRRYRQGRFCTLPHVIELAQVSYDKLFSILRAESQIEALVNPFVTAYLNDAREQLEGQIASAKISLSRLSSPQLYYILSGNDFSLDINNPEEPKIVCMGNNPQKTQTYGAVLSLYVTAMTRVINKKKQLPVSLLFDEFPTIYFNGMDNLIATARSNKVATTLAIQDGSQLKLHYGKEQADVIMNIVGNIISGQVGGETAKHLSEKFGKILQDRQSIAINRSDISVTKSRQLDMAVPVSKIASLSSGEFAGIVSDNPDQKIELKMFCSEIINDHEALSGEEAGYKDLPVISGAGQKDVEANYLCIKSDVAHIVHTELERMLDTPELSELIIRKEASG